MSLEKIKSKLIKYYLASALSIGVFAYSLPGTVANYPPNSLHVQKFGYSHELDAIKDTLGESRFGHQFPRRYSLKELSEMSDSNLIKKVEEGRELIIKKNSLIIKIDSLENLSEYSKESEHNYYDIPLFLLSMGGLGWFSLLTFVEQIKYNKEKRKSKP